METTFFNLTKPKQYIQNCTDLFRLPRAFDTFNIVIIHIDTRIFTYGANSNEKMDNRVTITFRNKNNWSVHIHWIIVSEDTRRSNSNNNAVVEVFPGNLDQGVFARARRIGPSSSILRDASVTIGRWWFPLPFFTTSGWSSIDLPSRRSMVSPCAHDLFHFPRRNILYFIRVRSTRSEEIENLNFKRHISISSCKIYWIVKARYTLQI